MLGHQGSSRRFYSYSSYFWGAVFSLFVFLNGVVVAIFPEIMAMLAVVYAFSLVIIFATYGVNPSCLRNEKLMSILLLILMSIYVLWPTYLILKVGALPKLEPRRLALLVSISFFVVMYIGSRLFRHDVSWARNPEHKFASCILLLYLFWRLCSCMLSQSPVAGISYVLREFINYFLVYFVSFGLFRYANVSSRASQLIIWLALIVSVYVFIEWTTGYNFFVTLTPYFTGGIDSDDVAAMTAMQSVSRVRDGLLRAQGTFEHPLVLSEFASIAFCFALSSILFCRKIHTRLVSLCACVLTLFVIYASGSRSGVVFSGAGAGVVFLLWLLSSKKKISKSSAALKILLFFGLISSSILIAIPTIQLFAYGASSEQKESSSVRVEMLERGIPAIAESPIFGLGVGEALNVAGIVGRKGVVTLDNQYLALAIDSGLPALLFLVASLLYGVWLCIRRAITGPADNLSFYASCAGGLVVLFLIRGAMWIPTNLFLAYILLGLIISSLSQERDALN